MRLTTYRNDKNPRSLWKVLVSRTVMFKSLYSNPPHPHTHPCPPPTLRCVSRARVESIRLPGSQARRYVTTSVSFTFIVLGAGGREPQSRCRWTSRGHRVGTGTTGGSGRASPKVAVSRVQPLVVLGGGMGQRAPVAKGSRGGVHAVAVHVHRVGQTLFSSGCLGCKVRMQGER